MTLKISKRGQVSPFIVMDVIAAAEARAKAGGQVFHMEVGQPGTPAPAAALAAARQALDTHRLGYTTATGIEALRDGISGHYDRVYGLSVAPEDIMITTGSSAGFVLAFLAAFDVGDRVGMVTPGYPAYRNILSALGLEAVLIETHPDSNYQPTPDLLARHGGHLDGLILASPSNPTGTMVTTQEMEALCDYCTRQGIRLISDEIYHGITYGTSAASALQFTRDAVVVNSFSKYFSMTGWRVGWLVVPKDMARAGECLGQNLYISPPTISQIAATAALGAREELEGFVAAYAENRQLLLDRLPSLGMEGFVAPAGAFYIYVDVAHLTNDADAFCKRMLAETGVAATPGVDFDPARGHHFIRFSFAGPRQEIEAGLQRLATWPALAVLPKP